MDDHIRITHHRIVARMAAEDSQPITASELQSSLAAIEKAYHSIVSSQVGQMENSMKSSTEQLSNLGGNTGASLKLEDLENALAALETPVPTLELVVSPSYMHESYIDLTKAEEDYVEKYLPEWSFARSNEPHRLLTGPAGLRRLESMFPNLRSFVRIRELEY